MGRVVLLPEGTQPLVDIDLQLLWLLLQRLGISWCVTSEQSIQQQLQHSAENGLKNAGISVGKNGDLAAVSALLFVLAEHTPRRAVWCVCIARPSGCVYQLTPAELAHRVSRFGQTAKQHLLPVGVRRLGQLVL